MNDRGQRTFQLVGRLGRGTTTEVNLCRLLGVQGFTKEIVVKRLLSQHAGNAEVTGKFLEQARLAAKLSHPHIAQVFEVGEDAEGPYVAMEYVRGVTLALIAARIHLARNVHYGHLAKIMAGICDALAYVHAARDEQGAPLGSIYRDILPSNIIVSMQGAAKLIDLAPEPVADLPLDQRADVFAAGVTLFELTTWRNPFGSGWHRDAQGLERARTGHLVRPSKIVPGYPPPLEKVVLAALERSPAQPSPPASQLRDWLEEFAAQPDQRSNPAAVAQWLRELFPDFSSLTRASGWTLPPAAAPRATGAPAALPPNLDEVVTPPAQLITEEQRALAGKRPRSRSAVAVVLGSGWGWKLATLAATGVAIGVMWETSRSPAPTAVISPAPESEPAAPAAPGEEALPPPGSDPALGQQERAAAQPAQPPAIENGDQAAPPEPRAVATASQGLKRQAVHRRGPTARRHGRPASPPPPARPRELPPPAQEPGDSLAPGVAAVAPPGPAPGASAGATAAEPPPAAAAIPPPTPPPAAEPSAPGVASLRPSRGGDSAGASAGLVRSSLSGSGPVVSARPKDPVPVPSLPRVFASPDPEQVARVCQMVENAAVRLAGVSPEYARGITSALRRSLRPQSSIYPIAMYYLVVREAGLGHDSAAAAANLAAAQSNGLILRYRDLPGIDTGP